MAQVAINWVANRPGVASVLLGASRPEQFQDNLGALEFELPGELVQLLNETSALPSRFPYTFFTPAIQGMITGGVSVGSKLVGYAPPVLIEGAGAGASTS